MKPGLYLVYSKRVEPMIPGEAVNPVESAFIAQYDTDFKSSPWYIQTGVAEEDAPENLTEADFHTNFTVVGQVVMYPAENEETVAEFQDGFYFVYDPREKRYTIAERDSTLLRHIEAQIGRLVDTRYVWQILGEDNFLTDDQMVERFKIHNPVRLGG